MPKRSSDKAVQDAMLRKKRSDRDHELRRPHRVRPIPPLTRGRVFKPGRPNKPLKIRAARVDRLRNFSRPATVARVLSVTPATVAQWLEEQPVPLPSVLIERHAYAHRRVNKEALRVWLSLTGRLDLSGRRRQRV